jgi:hypothetical protein
MVLYIMLRWVLGHGNGDGGSLPVCWSALRTRALELSICDFASYVYFCI